MLSAEWRACWCAWQGAELRVEKGRRAFGQKCAQCDAIMKGGSAHACVGCWVEAGSDPRIPLVGTREDKGVSSGEDTLTECMQKPRK